jgi:heat shock protein HslJ
LLAAIVGAVALVLAGCASPGSGGSAAGPSGSTPSGGDQTHSNSDGMSDRLAGRTFLSTSVTGHDLAAGSMIRISFDDHDALSADAGCNALSGPYRVEQDTLIATRLAQTEMGCDQALMDQDAWFADLLGSGLTVDLQGDVLTLTGTDVTMRLTDRRVVDPDRPLEGTTWVLDGIITGTGPDGSVSSVPQGITATLRIADGKIHFFDGLNDSDGPVTVGPDAVHIVADIYSSAVGCAAGSTCSVDLSVLTHDFDYRITAGHLTVTGTGQYADRGLTFIAQDSPSTGIASGVTGAGSTSTEVPTTSSGEISPGTPPPGTPDQTGSGRGSAPPARPGPTATGAASDLTSSAAPRPATSGRHDSIPPQPSPNGGPGSVDGSGQLEPGAMTLPGHSFRLTGLFTDAGGADTMFADARFTIAFGPTSATAESSCGTISYPTVRYYRNDFGPMVDLGDPTGPSCSLGRDPAGVPTGQLIVGVQDGKLFLSTGFVGWWFAPVD